ncbi:MAG: ABC transporter permease, partial [Gemmatimonadota bacterium]|nr:ABC transporter permease [Gemmatimonadota bacterium]
MFTPPGVWRLAWRESRTARRSLLLYMSAISLGAAALVAIDSYSANVQSSVREQSRSLMGGDISLSSSKPIPANIDSTLDSLSRRGIPVARVTTFPSMAVVPRTTGTHLAQVRGVTDNYPFYGAIVTRPEGVWSKLGTGPYAIVEPSLLTSLGASIGDTLRLGFGTFTIIGSVEDAPGNSGMSDVFGARVYIPAKYIAETQLLVFGSTADRQVLLKLNPGVDPNKFIKPLKKKLDSAQVRSRTVTEAETLTADAIDNLTNFIGIVGLVALLLGGIGVASGVRAFVSRKIDTVAILRTLGASSGQVLLIYVTQAAAMGLVGALIGATLGVAIQFAIPLALKDMLPVDVSVSFVPQAVLTGLIVGGWTALIFALRPLLALRNVSPLQTLRRDTDANILRMSWSDIPRLLVNLALVASVVVIALMRAGNWKQAIGISLATGAVILALVSSAALLSFVAKRSLRRGWPYVVRQGVANLYRPGNQTRAVVLALGFGAFLVTTLYLVHDNVLRRFNSMAMASRGNVVFFDIQEDQEIGMEKIVRASGSAVVETSPVVTMRIAAVNGKNVTDIIAAARADSAKPRRERSPLWGLRREYRSTYRDSLGASESLVKGKWFVPRASIKPGDTASVSAEESVAQSLNVKIGDVITWDVQGVEIPARITSLRKVNWTRFEPNFFMVFEPAALEAAPKQFVLLTQVRDKNSVNALQRATVNAYPNVSSIDLSSIRRTVEKIVSKVSLAIRFIALFSLGISIPVLFSAVSATKRDRLREGVLLKTLGASRGQVARILLVEYALLGALGAFAGMVLAIGGGWAVMHYSFKTPFTPAYGGAAAIALGTMAL